jgi:sulfur carrier protein
MIDVQMIDVTVNGQPRRFAERSTVAHLVDDVGCGRRGVAVAVNEEVVPRSAWDATELAAGDRIEILRAAQGG